jgi:hypothetical protein
VGIVNPDGSPGVYLVAWAQGGWTWTATLASATPGFHWDVVIRPGEQAYYQRLVSQGLLGKGENLIESTE